jgi:hypothetical protein
MIEGFLRRSQNKGISLRASEEREWGMKREGRIVVKKREEVRKKAVRMAGERYRVF